MSKTLVLEFEEYEGFEARVTLSPIPTRKYLRVVDLMSGIRLNSESIGELFAEFAPLIESWTLDTPTTADGLFDIDLNLALAIIGNWISGVSEVPLPLLRKPSDGTPSEAPKES